MQRWNDYLRERRGSELLESAHGFAVFSFPNPTVIWLEDIYVDPDHRRGLEATRLADQVAELGRARGAKHMMGSVDLSAKNVTESLKTVLSYGLKFHNAEGTGLYFTKEL